METHWRDLLGADPVPRLLSSSEPAARWVALTPLMLQASGSANQIESMGPDTPSLEATAKAIRASHRLGLQPGFEPHPGGKVLAPQDRADRIAALVEIEDDDLTFPDLEALGLDHAAVHRQVVNEQRNAPAVDVGRDVRHENRSRKVPAFLDHAAQSGRTLGNAHLRVMA